MCVVFAPNLFFYFNCILWFRVLPRHHALDARHGAAGGGRADHRAAGDAAALVVLRGGEVRGMPDRVTLHAWGLELEGPRAKLVAGVLQDQLAGAGVTDADCAVIAALLARTSSG